MEQSEKKALAEFMQQVVAIAKQKDTAQINSFTLETEQAPERLPEARTPTEMALQAAGIVNDAIAKLKDRVELEKFQNEVKAILK